MSTSDINIKKAGSVYLFISVLCMVFGAVYEYFSHGVYSAYMIYAFAVPLIGGALPACIISLSGKKPAADRAAFNLWNSAMAALTAGCIVKGILDIYGTSNRLTYFYLIAGIFMAVTALAVQLIRLKKTQESKQETSP